jgi:hypothetical protein
MKLPKSTVLLSPLNSSKRLLLLETQSLEQGYEGNKIERRLKSQGSAQRKLADARGYWIK